MNDFQVYDLFKFIISDAVVCNRKYQKIISLRLVQRKLWSGKIMNLDGCDVFEG